MSDKELFVVVLFGIILGACGKATVVQSATPVSVLVVTPTPTPTIKPTELFETMTYQPMQCEKTPWEVWGELGEVALREGSTSEQLIVAYYLSQSIEVTDVTKVENGLAVCDACSVCPMDYSFWLKTKSENIESLKATGWH